MAECTGFDATIKAVKGTRFEGGQTITVPVTIAFGSRDYILTRGSRNRGQLPAHHQWIALPGCGHVPMWDAPDLVADVILAGSSTR
ncbi:alpha/beta fold hydrolase [Nocardia gipuzkoensis]|uniref:alpha/beta fold hydrolase n=1 Tax=Nocardia gipuzkoensis TaxID=2749991 RepID=UPI003EE2B546